METTQNWTLTKIIIALSPIYFITITFSYICFISYYGLNESPPQQIVSFHGYAIGLGALILYFLTIRSVCDITYLLLINKFGKS